MYDYLRKVFSYLHKDIEFLKTDEYKKMKAEAIEKFGERF